MTHTGAVERITGTRGVRDVGYCGRNAVQDNLPIFLVRGSFRAQSELAGAAFPSTFKPVATSLLALVSAVYDKEVRSRRQESLHRKQATTLRSHGRGP